MKYLVDENLPASFCLILKALGFDARHVQDVGLTNTPDEIIVEFAGRTGETILTNDLDFSRIMALSGEKLPSVITFRLAVLNHEVFDKIARFNFSKFEADLAAGCLVTIDDGGIRVKRLPVVRG